MLKLEWVPNGNPGKPGTDGYDAATDSLNLLTDTGLVPVQSFAKGVAGAAYVSRALKIALDQWIASVQASRIVVMAHGYQYDPADGDPGDDPYNLVYAVPSPAGTTDYHNSWLPLVGETDNFGNKGQEIALSFAWISTGGVSQYEPAGWRNSYQYAALDLCPSAAKALATVLRYLNGSGKIIYILAHSLGTRLVSQAIGLLQSGVEDTNIQRVVLLGGAEFRPDAKANLLNRGLEVINIGSQSDEVLQWGADAACAPFRPIGSGTNVVVGRDGLEQVSDWLDLQIDLPDTITWLKQQKYSVSATPDPATDGLHPAAGLGHWVYYMNNGATDHQDTPGGNRKLVTDLLADPEMDIDWFRKSGLAGIFGVGGYGQITVAPPVTPASYDDRVILDNPQLANELGLSNDNTP